MIYHFIECLKRLGFKIRMEVFITAHLVTDHSSLLSIIKLEKIHDKNYLTELKNDLKMKYCEIRNDMVNSKMEAFLHLIWGQIGITMCDDAFYPFRNAMMVGFLNEQNLIYDEVFDQFCDHMNMARKTKSHVCMEYVKQFLWPTLLTASTIQHGGKGAFNSSAEDKLLMKKLSVTIKLAADELAKTNK